jgi:hypothetical protein
VYAPIQTMVLTLFFGSLKNVQSRGFFWCFFCFFCLAAAMYMALLLDLVFFSFLLAFLAVVYICFLASSLLV